MSMSVRRAVATAAALLCCALSASPALAQQGEPFSGPPLKEGFPDGSGAQRTPTPSPTATGTATRTPRPTATATSTPTVTATPTPKPRPNRRDDLPATGTDALRVGLMGFTLLGFGISLRLRVADGIRRRRL
ncbi:MAG: hypothetical protein WKF94_01115 [Solirubrobacteraceae bacterium]